MQNKFIIDASVLINTLGLDKVLTSTSEFLLENVFTDSNSQIMAPSLIRYELSSSLVGKKKKDPNTKLDRVFEDFNNLGIVLYYFSEEEFKEIISLSIQYQGEEKRRRLSVYDASYIYLAKKMKTQLLTEDKFMKELSEELL